MPNIKFKTKGGASFWCEYRAHDYDDIELLSITAEDSKIELFDILPNWVEDLAVEAAMMDYAETYSDRINTLRKEWQNPA